VSDLRSSVGRLGLSGAGLLSRGLPAGLLLALLVATPAPAADPQETPGPVQVRFAEPAAPGLVLGDTRITVEASTTPDASIARVEIYVDGRLLSTLTRPPYSLVWNAGTRFTRRELRAVAIDTLGRSAETVRVTRPLYIGQYEEVRLVDVYATVRDPKGRPVLDLGRDDFILLEDGRPQTVSHFTSARVPLNVALLIDASNSMNLGGKIDLARRAAEEFVKSADPDDRMMVLAFNDRVTGLTELVSDHRRLEAAIESIRAEGGTALYDALFQAAELSAGVGGRRAIVLVSDGRDQALADNEPGSLHLFEEALERVHRSEIAVYTIGLGHHLDQELTLDGARSLEDVLKTLARQTGGRYYNPDRPGQLSQVYRQIASDLKSQYMLAYTSTNPAHDGRWRTITLKVRPPGLQVETRAGYYAPGPDGP
jgi:VWFA-related protein